MPLTSQTLSLLEREFLWRQFSKADKKSWEVFHINIMPKNCCLKSNVLYISKFYCNLFQMLILSSVPEILPPFNFYLACCYYIGKIKAPHNIWWLHSGSIRCPPPSPTYMRLKGQLHGRAEIFKGLKMTFRTKILEKKLYHVNQHQKYYKLCFDNFSLRRLFFLTALLIAVRLNFSDSPRDQDNL